MSGLAATMTIIAMGLGYAISIGDPTSMSANLSLVSAGLHITGSTATFVDSLATLTMAAAVLSAAAIAAYFGVGYAVATPLPAISGALAHAINWRACFVVVPLIAAIGLLVIEQAPHNAVDALHTLAATMAIGPVIAIVLALWLIKPRHD